MTKIDIADRLAKNEEIVITKKNAKILVDMMFNIMEDGLREDGIITVPGFFVFEKNSAYRDLLEILYSQV